MRIKSTITILVWVTMISACHRNQPLHSPAGVKQREILAPVAPFSDGGASAHRTDIPRTKLDLRVIAATNVIASVSKLLTNGQEDVLVFPIRIENHSRQVITAKIAHEWYGGMWPPTDLGAAVKRIDGVVKQWRESEVYLVGEVGSLTEPTAWQPGQSHEFQLRLNWPGTGSVMGNGSPLIDSQTPGHYIVRVSLVFKTGNASEYLESPAMEITVRDNKRM